MIDSEIAPEGYTKGDFINIPPLPEDRQRVLEMQQALQEPLVFWIEIQEQRFAGFPELQQKLNPEFKQLFTEAIAECFVMLGLDERHIPRFFIARTDLDRDIFRDPAEEFPAMMIAGYREELPPQEQDLLWVIDWRDLHRQSFLFETYRNTDLLPSFLHRVLKITGHEAFHIYDVYFNPARAREAGELNARTTFTEFGEGEREPDEFGFYYARAKIDQYLGPVDPVE